MNDDHAKLTKAQMDALVVHPGWKDMREGCLFCRIETMLDRSRLLRAEVTWGDNGDELDDDEYPSKLLYSDPELWLETNEPETKAHGLRTFDGINVSLTQAEAVGLVTGDPAALLTRYAREIARLKVHPSLVEHQ